MTFVFWMPVGAILFGAILGLAAFVCGTMAGKRRQQVVYQKEDGKWYFDLMAYDDQLKTHSIPMTFGPYDDQEKAEMDESQADSMLC